MFYLLFKGWRINGLNDLKVKGLKQLKCERIVLEKICED